MSFSTEAVVWVHVSLQLKQKVCCSVCVAKIMCKRLKKDFHGGVCVEIKNWHTKDGR